MQQALYETAEWWKGGSAPSGLRGEAIALPARLARVAADAVALYDTGETDTWRLTSAVALGFG